MEELLPKNDVTELGNNSTATADRIVKEENHFDNGQEDYEIPFDAKECTEADDASPSRVKRARLDDARSQVEARVTHVAPKRMLSDENVKDEQNTPKRHRVESTQKGQRVHDAQASAISPKITRAIIVLMDSDDESDYGAHADKSCDAVSSLQQFGKTRLDALGAQILVMTHTPMGGAFLESLSTSVGDRCDLSSILLHELSTMTDFEKRLTNFYDGKRCGRPKILVLQTDLRIATIEQIEHCRFLCDKIRQRKIDETSEDKYHPHHIFFCIHLSRGAEAHHFPLDYDNRWKLLFLDTMESAPAGLPTLNDMINASIAQVLRLPSVNFAKVLQMVVRHSLARLAYSARRTLDDATRQIHALLDLMQNQVEFVDLLLQHVCDMLDASESTSCETWYLEIARKPYTVTLAGTFHAALQKRLLEAVSVALSALLTQLDRNDNLKLVDQPGSRHLWYQIATSVLAQPYVMFLGKAAIDASARSQLSSFKFDVECDAGSRSVAGFRSQFPFSFFIAKKIEGLRELSQGDLASLERQWTMTGLNITPHRTEEEIAHYVTDFLSMYLPHGMPLHVDVKHVWTLMQHAVEQRHRTSLLGVHAAYWAIGGRLRIYFSLMDLAHLGVSVLEKINALNGQYDMYILGHCSRGLISELRTEGFSDNWFVRSRKALLHVYDLRLHAEGVEGASSNNQYNIDAQRDNKKRQQCDSVVRLDLLVRVAELCKDASIERHLPNDMFSFDADAIPRDFPKRFKVLESWMHVLLELPSRSNKNVCVKIAQELPKDGYFKVARLSVMRALMVHPLGYAALEEVMDRGSLIYILAVTVFEENQAQCQPPCKRTYSTVSAAYERAVLNINLRRYADTYQNAPAALFTDESSRLLVLKRWLHFHGQAGLRQIFQDHKLDWLRASMEFVSAALGGSQMTWDALKDNPKYLTARRKLRDICAGNCIQDGFGDTLRANLVHASALFTELHLPRANGIVLPCCDTFYRRYLNADDHHTRILALAAGLGGWKLKNRASADRIMMTRCLVHLLSIALHGVGVLSVFRQLLLEPRALIRWWLPAMPDDVRRMLGGQFNNAWYTCKNGHPYYIGECGAPMQRGVCPECNEPIGGTRHTLLKSNKGMARTAITAPQGYSLEIEDATDKWLNIRNLPDVCARALRWCLHGLMFVGSQAGIDYSCIRNNALSATWTTQLQRQTFFEKQLVHDWTILKEHLHNGENVALYLHHALHRLVEGSKGMPANAPKLSSEKARGDWEVSIFRMGLNVLTGTVVTADELRTKYQMDGSATAVLADIAAELPAEDDFAFRDGTTAALAPLEDLKNVDLQAHELLGRVIAQYPQPLMALEYLRDCIHWVTFVHATYSMKIDRERARLMTIRDALNDAGERERKAFQGFQEAWRLAWPSVTHYDCLEVPSGYKEVVDMQDTRPLSFCMASEKDESICCLAFLQLLVNQHNALLEGVATHNTEEVPSHMLVASHVIDLRSVRLEDLLAKRCLTYDRGARKYDLNHATNTLRHALSVKPRIRLVLPEFVFLKEGAAFRLHQIPQKDLPLSIQHILTQALAHNASVASSCLDLVDMAMHFLRAQTEVQLDDGNTVAKMSLKDYLSSVLLVAHTNDCPITASEHIRLEHLEHLRTFLSDACNGRQETLVRPKYKTPLPETVMAALEDALTRVDASMLSGCVSDLMKEHLGEDSLNANESLKVVLEMFRADLSEQAWWQYFPKELLVAHTAALSERLGANRA